MLLENCMSMLTSVHLEFFGSFCFKTKRTRNYMKKRIQFFALKAIYKSNQRFRPCENGVKKNKMKGVN